MARIVSVEQMRAIESEADRKGMPFERMMECAGEAVFLRASEHYGPVTGRRVVVLCGGGNNGGDGLVAAVHFSRAGAAVEVILASQRKDDDSRLRAAVAAGCAQTDGTADANRSRMSQALEGAEILVDAVLGTGTRLPLRPPLAGFLDSVLAAVSRNAHRPFVVAVDCPSGVDCDTGAAAPQTIPADLTVTLAAAKPGLITFPAAELTGRLVVAGIGLPPDLDSLKTPGVQLADADLVRGWLRARPRNSHKGTFGRMIVIGGSINYPGAPALAGLGAYRAGAGLVTLAVPGTVYRAAVSILPEATWIVLPEDFGVIAAEAADVLVLEILKAQALVIGPGFGREKPTAAFLKTLLRKTRHERRAIGFGTAAEKGNAETSHLPPSVVDADALRILPELPGWTGMLPNGSVLTPHPGEMAGLTGLTGEKIRQDRTGIAQRFAQQWNTIVVLKGAFTVVAAPDGRCAIEPFATPALARAGTGDVLAGTIGGLIAQGVESWEAAVLGAYLHGRAGELAAAHAGVTDSVLARDVALFLSQAIAELRGSG
ncbi:MAG: NAD(P)H-hydrate dehydratase [Anaerolineales bacterium]|nr:NAD(P)H-hydrate dehydratase [Anaerolineales bacterium]